jgi:hypothetical protein
MIPSGTDELLLYYVMGQEKRWQFVPNDVTRSAYYAGTVCNAYARS